jgi:hypothetical protein
VSLAEYLRMKSGDYELLAEWHAERAPVDEQHAVACHAMAVVGIVLRELAEAIDVEWMKEFRLRVASTSTAASRAD